MIVATQYLTDKVGNGRVVQPMVDAAVDHYVAQIAEFWRDPYEHLANTLPTRRVRVARKRTHK
jgi:hypothetical protein